VIHIAVCEPKSYGSLGELCGLSPVNAAEIYSMIRRREFIAGLGSAAAWPVVVQAQQAKMPVIGWLSPVSGQPPAIAPFLQGLKETGYVVGQNVAIEYRWAEN
jgi:hypothetical protein